MKNSMIQIFILLVTTVSITYAQSSQVPVQLSMPHTTARPGETLEIPVEISDVTGLNISATDLLVTYDARIVTAVRPIINGALTERWSEAYRVGFVENSQDTTGLIDIALATGNRIPTGSGIFLKIRFTVSDSAKDGQVSLLIFSESILNNRNPQVVTQNGSITIKMGGSGLPGDFNDDCEVNFQDFIQLAQHFGSKTGDSRYNAVFDLNLDGQISFSDFIVFAQHFDESCS